MKLDYLHDIKELSGNALAGPHRLLRLYEFDEFELSKLRHLIKRTLIDRDGLLIISNLDFIEPLNCTLTLQLSEDDKGIKFAQPDEHIFIGQFCRNTYINMLEIIDLLEDGFNWLYDPVDEDQIDLLLSQSSSTYPKK